MTNKIEPPIGEQPEGNLDALGKLDEATKKLFANLDRLGENIKQLEADCEKLFEENQDMRRKKGTVL